MEDKDPIILENEFYNKEFRFSYSSINLLLYSPALFYKQYILKQKEERLDTHLVDGKVIHALILEESKFNDNFIISPTDLPSDNVRKVINNVFYKVSKTETPNILSASSLSIYGYEVVEELLAINLHQSLKTDEQRIAKIVTDENESYWKFLCIKGTKTVIDQETYLRCSTSASLVKNDATASELLNGFGKLPMLNEEFIKVDLKGKPYGLHGQVDNFAMDVTTRTLYINDLKTSGKTLAEFKESVEFYKYWMQAAMYVKIIKASYSLGHDWHVKFSFIVIDKYQQVYTFKVCSTTLQLWIDNFEDILKKVDYHYNSKRYDLPYEFLIGDVIL